MTESSGPENVEPIPIDPTDGPELTEVSDTYNEIEGYVGAIAGVLVAPHGLSGKITSIRASFRNIDESIEQPFASSGFSIFVKTDATHVTVENKANVARFVRLVIESEGAST